MEAEHPGAGVARPNSSASIRAQSRRAARYFAISSKKVRWAEKKNESRGAAASASSPRRASSTTTARAWARQNASSSTAVAPASRRLYPTNETGFQRGRWRIAHSIVSHSSRNAPAGGNARGAVVTAVSMRKSFWLVPARQSGASPRRRAIAAYIARSTIAMPGLQVTSETLTAGS